MLFRSVGVLAKSGDRGGFARYHSRVRKLPEFSGELPAATMADELETPGEGQVRAMITYAGNPVLSTPDGAGHTGWSPSPSPPNPKATVPASAA